MGTIKTYHIQSHFNLHYLKIEILPTRCLFHNYCDCDDDDDDDDNHDDDDDALDRLPFPG